MTTYVHSRRAKKQTKLGNTKSKNERRTSLSESSLRKAHQGVAQQVVGQQHTGRPMNYGPAGTDEGTAHSQVPGKKTIFQFPFLLEDVEPLNTLACLAQTHIRALPASDRPHIRRPSVRQLVEKESSRFLSPIEA